MSPLRIATIACAVALRMSAGAVRPTAAPPPAPAAATPAPTFDAHRAAPCLDAAAERLARHVADLDAMVAAAEGRGPLRGVGPLVLQASPFAAFEGAWRGRWADRGVRHLWLSVDADAQLVVMDAGLGWQRGINLRHDGALCGIVYEPDGRPRLHEGRFVPPVGDAPGHLLWLTPDRSYREHVRRTVDGPVYEIVEEGGVSARYTPWAPPVAAPAS